MPSATQFAPPAPRGRRANRRLSPSRRCGRPASTTSAGCRSRGPSACRACGCRWSPARARSTCCPPGWRSALRLWATLIQFLSFWKSFRPAWAYGCPGRSCRVMRPGAESLATTVKSPVGQRLAEEADRARAREVDRERAERQHQVPARDRRGLRARGGRGRVAVAPQRGVQRAVELVRARRLAGRAGGDGERHLLDLGRVVRSVRGPDAHGVRAARGEADRLGVAGPLACRRASTRRARRRSCRWR